jgi:hypothetical protein
MYSENHMNPIINTLKCRILCGMYSYHLCIRLRITPWRYKVKGPPIFHIGYMEMFSALCSCLFAPVFTGHGPRASLNQSGKTEFRVSRESNPVHFTNWIILAGILLSFFFELPLSLYRARVLQQLLAPQLFKEHPPPRLWSTCVYYHVHKSTSPDPVLMRFTEVLATTASSDSCKAFCCHLTLVDTIRTTL